MDAAQRILALTAGLTDKDLVLCLISGGGSALLTLPAEGLTLADKQRINRDLLNCGASISEMNCVRKHLSAIKGGRLALAAAPARVVSLIISDVPGDDLSVIASGPTVSAVTTSGDGATTYVTLSPAPAAGTTGFIVSQPNNNTLSQQSTWGGQMTPSQPLDCSGHALSTSWVNGPALNSGTGAGQANYFPAWASNPSGTHTYAQIASITIPSTFALVAHAQYSPISQANSNATVLEIGSRSAGLFLGTDSTHTHYQFMVNGGGSCAGGTVDGVEHSLVATYDGTNAYLYVDNSAVAGPCAFTFSGLTGVTARIGAYNNSPSSPATVAGNWYGWISGVRIYGRVLTSAERSLLYTSADR